MIAFIIHSFFFHNPVNSVDKVEKLFQKRDGLFRNFIILKFFLNIGRNLSSTRGIIHGRLLIFTEIIHSFYPAGFSQFSGVQRFSTVFTASTATTKDYIFL